MNVIEFVTSPNNPDGQLKKAVLNGPSAKAIHDHAYNWPHFTAIPSPSDEDLMIFTLSKLTGHADVRFGWALIKDKDIYERMATYTNDNTFGVSRDSQLRALKLIKVVLEGDGRSIFKYAYETMRSRWESLSQTVSLSTRFTLQEIAPRFCTFFQTVRGPSPAYAWLKCEREEDELCYQVLEAGGILSRDGTLFGAGSRYVRLSLIKSQDDFDQLLQHLNKLVLQDAVSILQALKNQWKNTPPNWVGSDPCRGNWDGVECGNSRVISITYSSIGLTGQLPGDIVNLSELQTLDLSSNKGLTGTLPTSIGNLKKLSNL
ncbi:tryptophan aminotransferase-related protein 4-like [Heracleum sosnowskyi]|uniref:Tryptophan aminotransferase-related protein 4-like n=1 Tax=Heracleum sosnowskyi TaxID=360622 RepID=A0AAD8MTY9_9APIA|nr:tryptophan aminotransferase-related protein 4-like [Heracleum sosnowskyi]